MIASFDVDLTSADNIDLLFVLGNQKLVELARKVDLVNPKQKGAPAATGSNVFEI
jgi:hypothetical protein